MKVTWTAQKSPSLMRWNALMLRWHDCMKATCLSELQLQSYATNRCYSCYYKKKHLPVSVKMSMNFPISPSDPIVCDHHHEHDLLYQLHDPREFLAATEKKRLVVTCSNAQKSSFLLTFVKCINSRSGFRWGGSPFGLKTPPHGLCHSGFSVALKYWFAMRCRSRLVFSDRNPSALIPMRLALLLLPLPVLPKRITGVAVQITVTVHNISTVVTKKLQATAMKWRTQRNYCWGWIFVFR